MTKSMQNGEKLGFSLAEALITLLIVCLITLASIPILTKKRRNMDSGSRGTWICTRNSSGAYVYWDKNNAVGDKNNPDTWETTGESSCTFIPPAGASKFSVTVIGGGGGGGNGYATSKLLAKVESGNTTSFSPSDTGMYDVLVIGGGGGGGAHQDRGSGAGGGGGGMFVGWIPLFAGSSYTLTAGKGGESGGSKFHGGSSDSNSHGFAESGGQSSLEVSSGTDSTRIIVNGGEGGEGIGCSKWSCGGGNKPGNGAVVQTAQYNSTWRDSNNRSAYAQSYNGRNGKPGEKYGCSKTNLGGKNQYRNYNGNVSTYGDGGDGGRYCEPFTSNKPGVGGIVVISQTEGGYGMGGKSATPSSYYLPSIPGVISVNIAERANAGQRGGNTVAKIMKGGVTGRTFTGYGADGGSVNRDISSATSGEPSQFTMKGGGAAAGSCDPKRQVPAGYGKITRTGLFCKKVSCYVSLEEYTMDKNSAITDNYVLPKGFVWSNVFKARVPYQIKDGAETHKEPEELLAYSSAYKDEKTYISYLLILDYFNSVNGDIDTMNQGEIRSFFPRYNKDDEDLIEFRDYVNKSDIYDKYQCYRDENLYYRKYCSEEEYTTEETYGYHEMYIEPASCNGNGGDGTSYGAGGGGGSAGDSPGVSSEGGKGGYGAVVVEW